MNERYHLIHRQTGRIVGAGSYNCMSDECGKLNARSGSGDEYILELA